MILAAHPQARGTLVDLPDTVERGREYLAGHGLDGRCAFAGQSFFDVLPAGGDLYVLSHVLHDWDDDQAAVILRRCAEAAGGRGRVVIIEGPGGEDGDGAASAEMNLRMLVLAGGRERGSTGYAALAAAAGLAVTATRTTPLGQFSIECVPSAPAARDLP